MAEVENSPTAVTTQIEHGRGVMESHILRLHPGQEIKSTLEQYVKENDLKAAFIITAVGSVTKATLRFAHDFKTGINEIRTFHRHLEILSLVGTLNDGSHLHISLSDKEGRFGNVIGGHVMGDLIVFTTCEVVIGNTVGLTVHRPFDKATGFPELAVVSCCDGGTKATQIKQS
ncbi:putative Bifunctional protein GlmU [Hypsibius exemplaris]|uniref:Bifunctional protein GlmU n=1 Tax=Hypsibius exemplaris TaxID=2072580 RepID=A0A1W0WTJ8_HYPEX|nr:putative Bifunctional protein GlmU [Hypsibius exemplaris]